MALVYQANSKDTKLLTPSLPLSSNTVKCAQSKSLSPGNTNHFQGVGCVQFTRARPCVICHVQAEHLPEWFSEGTATGKSTGKTHKLDGECTLLWLKERYPSHTQELDPCPSSSCAPALGNPQKYPPDPPWAALALHPHCVSG